MKKNKLSEKFSKYRFEIRHITVVFSILIFFQIILSFVQKSSLNDFLSETQAWYQRYSAEKLATVTSTSLELLFENHSINFNRGDQQRNIIASFNVVFKQQLIQESVQEISLILIKNHHIYLVDSGQKLYSFLSGELDYWHDEDIEKKKSISLFLTKRNSLKTNEVIFSNVENGRTFNILVPFVPDGEYLGAMYMKINPDFSFLTHEISANFGSVAIIYSALILIGLIAIFFISSQAVKERNEAQEKLFLEHEENLKKQIKLEKESLFTRRIYHTHHKAEKIMGFIKSDVRSMENGKLEDNKKRVITYSNFISRIIYDMKWYDQDMNTIVNPLFRTDINKILKFIVDNVFLRVSRKNEMFDINLNLDKNLPPIHVNEFIVWEIIEPIIQNSIDHSKVNTVKIDVSTKLNEMDNTTILSVKDNGKGIDKALMEFDENGVRKLFLEEVSTKTMDGTNSGYGCFISYQLAVTKCGWKMSVENLKNGGCKFEFIIKN